MCVGVIQFVFMFSNFYQLCLHDKPRIASVDLQWNIDNNWIENWTSLDLVMIIENAIWSYVLL